MTASGSDIWDVSDKFHYVWRTWTGDVTLTARVNGVSATDAWAKAGLMFRESLDANARNAFITVTPGNGISFQSRSSTGGGTTFSNIVGLAAPYWLKLQRTGNVFTPYHSADGITWTQTAAPVTLSLPTTCYVGFAATAHNNTLLTAAQFDHISLVGTVPPAPAGLSATAGNAQVGLNWSAASGATSYNVKRATVSGGAYTTIAFGITSTSYTDTDAGLTNGDTYYYVVSAVNTTGESAPSSEASATPVSAYQQWKLSNGLSLSLPDTATPDNDGVPILLKYATGLTPGTPATSPTVLSTVNNTLTLQFTRLSPAPVNYAVESSTELSTWTTIATLPMASDTWTGPASVAETGTGATRATTVTDTQTMASGPRRFLRLRVNVAALAGSAAVMPMPGFNLGNTLESTWGYAPPTKALIDSIADAGFKTLRVPCAWDFNSTNGTINAAYMTQVTNVVDWALADGMYVIINDHWDNGWFERNDFNSYDSNLNSKLINIWTQVANQFKVTIAIDCPSPAPTNPAPGTRRRPMYCTNTTRIGSTPCAPTAAAMPFAGWLSRRRAPGIGTFFLTMDSTCLPIRHIN